MADRAPRRPQIRVWYPDAEIWYCAHCGLPIGFVQDDRLTISHHDRSVIVAAPWCVMQRCQCGHVNYSQRPA